MEPYWQSIGTGEPVLLIMGLGMDVTGWWRTIPVLAARFRVIAFDNRGVGRSPRPPGPYSTAQMADDAAHVLDLAGERTAHVYGISLGGMIAQELVLRHPDRVRSLVLAATTPGGADAVPAAGDVLDLLRLRGQMPAEAAVWSSVPINYAPETRRSGGDRIARDIAQRLRYPIEPEPYAAQLAAALGHDTSRRLGDIRARTLVVHGEQDVLIPPANGRVLARRIAGAELHLHPGAAHLYFTDDDHIDVSIRHWLSARTSPGPSSPGRR
jgi:pimeloyl-ACP methyl ester carboxylesterase